MTEIPDLLGCPKCQRSIRKTLSRCPGCGLQLRVIRIELNILGNAIVEERLVAMYPEDVAAFTRQDPLPIDGDEE